VPYDVIGAVKKQFYLIKELDGKIKKYRDSQLQLSVEIMVLQKEQANYHIQNGDLLIQIRKLTKRLEALECPTKESSE